jgi:hypothetical protein
MITVYVPAATHFVATGTQSVINLRPSAAGLPTAPSRETEASVDARRVMRNGRPRGRW